MKSILFAVGLFAAGCSAQRAFEGYEYCAPQGATNLKVTRFEETYICITINGVQRAIFNPKADDYSLLNIQDCMLAVSCKAAISAQHLSAAQTSLPNGSGIIAKDTGYLANATCGPPTNLTDFFVTVEVSSLGTTQIVPYIYQKRSCDGSATFFPFLTAIVFVEDGAVQSITYDEDCAFCNGKSNCQANGFDASANDTFSSDVYVECGYSTAECSALAGGGADCDLRVSTCFGSSLLALRTVTCRRCTLLGWAPTQTGSSSRRATLASAASGSSPSAVYSMRHRRK